MAQYMNSDSGSIDADDVLAEACRGYKQFYAAKMHEMSMLKPVEKAKKTPENSDDARELGFKEGVEVGKREGYLEALAHLKKFQDGLPV